MEKEEGEAERRVKGKGRKEAKRLWIECLGGGTPVAAAEVFLWYKTGSEQATGGQRNGGDWFGMKKEEGKQQQRSRKQPAFLAVESKSVLVSNSSKVKSRGRLLRSPTRWLHSLRAPTGTSLFFSQHPKCRLARRIGPSHHQAVLVARRFALFCIARHSI